MPVILVVAPMAWGYTAAVAALGSLFAAAPIVGTELLIRKMREPSNHPLSEEEKASLERQNAISAERKATAAEIAEKITQSAIQAAKERAVLIEQQHETASMLLDATKEVRHTANILAEVSENSRERDASFNAGMTEQVTQLKDAAEHLPANLTLLLEELKEKLSMIESLNIKLTELQNESSTRESTLDKIAAQVIELTTQNQAQADTIKTLQKQKATLLETVNELTTELEIFDGIIQNLQNIQKTNSTAPTFFR